MIPFRTPWLTGLALTLAASTGLAQDSHPGTALFQQHCAACHNDPANTRAPALDALQLMSAQSLRYSLTNGVMQQQGSLLEPEQLNQVIDYLAAQETGSEDWVAGMMCNEDDRAIDFSAPVSMGMFGVDQNSSRHLTAEQAGLTDEDLANLELAWAVGFPKDRGLRAGGVVIGSTLFYTPDPTGKLLAMDTETACVKWAFDAGGPLRTSISYGELGDSGKKALIFASRRVVHALDPVSGEVLWKTDAPHSRRAGITGAPVLYKDTVIVPISGSGVGSGANPNYECCAEHGAVVALDAVTGEKRWTFHTTPDAEYTGKTSRDGVKLRGPSGAPVWSTPTVDGERGLVYATTGQNTSLPATDTSDAVLAINIETGKLQWGFQALANDVWHLACQEPWENSGPNCPSPEDSVLKDYDFGAAAILATTDDGEDILLAGQKSGDVWALNPDNGELVWRQTFGDGSPLGGVHWGMAADGKRVYAPINDPHFPQFKNYTPEPGMNAIDISTGKVLWRTPVEADCSPARQERFEPCGSKYGLSAAPIAIDESVVAGSIDGKLYVFDGETGDIVWQFDTLQEFSTLNGIEANGGSIDSHSLFAGDGMIFVGSGYGSFGQAPGNVLLGFKPKSQD